MQLSIGPVVVIERTVEGIEMGVLTDGTAFLTSRGLARLCGVAPSAVITQAASWKEGRRDSRLAKMLVESKFDQPSMYVATTRNGVVEHAFSADVCTVVLGYYAFEATPRSELARKNFLILARKSLSDYIYSWTGYDPRVVIPPAWRHFHDRLLLNVTPVGYFSVFREMTDMLVTAIRHGLELDAHTVPDLSVGKVWSNYWTENGLDARYGQRIKYEHNYPDDYPQAPSNPQEALAYPVDALGAFRKWLAEHYMPEKFPGYLATKVKQGVLGKDTADLVLAAVDSDLKRLPTPRP